MEDGFEEKCGKRRDPKLDEGGTRQISGEACTYRTWKVATLQAVAKAAQDAAASPAEGAAVPWPRAGFHWTIPGA